MFELGTNFTGFFLGIFRVPELTISPLFPVGFSRFGRMASTSPLATWRGFRKWGLWFRHRGLRSSSPGRVRQLRLEGENRNFHRFHRWDMYWRYGPKVPTGPKKVGLLIFQASGKIIKVKGNPPFSFEAWASSEAVLIAARWLQETPDVEKSPPPSLVTWDVSKGGFGREGFEGVTIPPCKI